jgi:processing peptidase subunit alpha
MGLQLLARGKFSAAEYAGAVQGLTGADVAGAVAAMLKTPPTVIAAGGITDVPKWDTVAKRFA